MFKKDRNGNARKLMSHRSKQGNALVLFSGENTAWTAHDLRRSGATQMQALKVPLDVIDRCQNHKLKGSKSRRPYFHHEYAEEKREAWQLLGAWIEQVILAGDNVMPLTQRSLMPDMQNEPEPVAD
jgi:integrase